MNKQKRKLRLLKNTSKFCTQLFTRLIVEINYFLIEKFYFQLRKVQKFFIFEIFQIS